MDRANSLADPLATLQSFHKYIAKDGTLIEIQCSRVQHLMPNILSWIFDLMERNMKQMYEQSDWGWNWITKQNELTESTAWYLIATFDGKHIGFSHFRFDIDNGVEVLYCYELQLEQTARRKGLGCFMMQALESMAFQNKMQKVVLTVFKHNPAAIPFFHTLGYNFFYNINNLVYLYYIIYRNYKISNSNIGSAILKTILNIFKSLKL